VLPTALIPIRIARTAKRRLAHALSPDERVRLVRALFEHVVCVVQDAGLPLVALSAFEMPDVNGAQVWLDEKAGLNGAIDAALDRLGAPVLVIHADLPLLSTADIDRVLTAEADVVVARARDGGTNGLLLRRLIRPAFGPSSAAAHATRARELGLRAHVLDIPGFALDVDDETSLSASGAAYVLGTRP
jgi:2-phospho-L-lactate guanylyltransferase